MAFSGGWIRFSARAEVSFSEQIAPILAEQCLECHRAEKAKGAYRLDTFDHLLRAGDSEARPVVPGNPEQSELFQLISSKDDADRMPKKADPLPAEEIALIRAWIASGAAFDGSSQQAALLTIMPEPKRPEPPAKYPRPIPVTAMALNGDGKVLISSGYTEVLSWDPSNGKLRTRIGGLPERILGLTFLKGGPWMAVAGGSPGRSGEVWLVNYSKPADRKRIAQLRDCAMCVVAAPDGGRIFAAGADNHVRCFEFPSGKVLWDAEAHADWIVSLAISADGRRIATASRDRTARVLDASNGQITATFTGHSVAVLSVAFQPGGNQLLSGGADGEVRRWSIDGTGIKDSTIRPARSEVVALGFTDPNTPLVGCGNGLLAVIDSTGRKVKTELARQPDRIDGLAVHGTGDSQKVLTAGHNGDIRVIETAGAKQVLKFIASPGW